MIKFNNYYIWFDSNPGQPPCDGIVVNLKSTDKTHRVAKKVEYTINKWRGK